MNTAMIRSNGRRQGMTLVGAFFAILVALLFGSVAQTNTASAQEPPRDSAVPLDASLPTGNLKICKVWEAEGEADSPETTFTFLVEIDYAAPDGVIDDDFFMEVSLKEGQKGCSRGFNVPLGARVTITEILPDGFNSAAGYPKHKWSLAGLNGEGVGASVTVDIPTTCLTGSCNVLFTNKEGGPRRIPIQVCKVYLNNEDGSLNPGTVFNFDINGNPFNINAAESETNCKKVWVTVYSNDELVTISENLPNGWPSAPGYPKVEMDENPFDDANHGISSDSITFEIGQCIEFGQPVLKHLLQEYACTIIFYNLEDVPGTDECTELRECPPVCIDNCPEEECEVDCDPPVDECREDSDDEPKRDLRQLLETREEDCDDDEPQCTEDCDDDEPQCTENCGEPLCADECDDTPGDTPGTDLTPDPKAPDTGNGMLLDAATNPMLMAGAGIAILMVTVLAGTAILPKRR